MLQQVSYVGVDYPNTGTVTDKRTVSTFQTSYVLERIIVDANIHFGKPIIKGTRITVQDIRELIGKGLAFDQIVKDYYPDLKREDIEACQQYPFSISIVS